jgi:hypothetical protein
VASSGQIVHVHHPLVTAMLAGHKQATDAMPAHAAERERGFAVEEREIAQILAVMLDQIER